MLLPDVASEVDSVDVLRLPDPTRPHTMDPDGDLLAVWDQPAAHEALKLVAAVPDDDLRRCFTPAYAIRARRAGAELFEIQFCYHCHGALLKGPTVPPALATLHGFAATSPEAQQLLTLLRAAAEAGPQQDHRI